MKKTERGTVVIVIYVDDLIVINITSDSGHDIANVKEMLCVEFDMKDLGELRYFLGIEVVRTKGYMVGPKALCLGNVGQIWYDGMQANEYTLGTKYEVVD